MSANLFDYQFQLVIKELEFLQSAIANYNLISMTIKGWAITVAGGLALVAVRDDHALYLILAFITTFSFWMIDGIFKNFQRVFIYRYNVVEHYLRTQLETAFRNQRIDLSFPAIGARETFRIARARNRWVIYTVKLDTSLPYIAMIFSLAILEIVLLCSR